MLYSASNADDFLSDNKTKTSWHRNIKRPLSPYKEKVIEGMMSQNLRNRKCSDVKQEHMSCSIIVRRIAFWQKRQAVFVFCHKSLIKDLPSFFLVLVLSSIFSFLPCLFVLLYPSCCPSCCNSFFSAQTQSNGSQSVIKEVGRGHLKEWVCTAQAGRRRRMM